MLHRTASDEGTSMLQYRLYCMDGSGQISFAVEVEANNDAEAIETAREQKRHALKCEVWERHRLVAVLDAHDLAD